MIDKDFKIINGDSLVVLDTLEPESVDSIVTDPPYGLTSITKRFGKEGSAPCKEGKDGSFARLTRGFMGKVWDGSGIEYNVELWKKAYKVLKPGGYLLAFGGTRTYHRIACAIEDAGFEIRDTIMWLYGSGFPKSHNVGLDIDKKLGCPDRGHRIAVANRFHPDGTLEPNGEDLPAYEGKTELGKQWQGWGTALKPAYEPIIVARKPPKGSVADNVMKYGVGGINIDDCRVENENGDGRFPANVIHDGSEEVTSGFPNSQGSGGKPFKATDYEEKQTATNFTRGDFIPYNDEGSASRFFYCAKASSKDRDEGLFEFDEKKTGELQGGRKEGSAGSIMLNEDGSTRVNPYAGTGAVKKNFHPTVKPTELMQYLVRLVSPKGATILDPFNGSGSTGKAVAFENRERNMGYKYIGIELDPDYCKISEARIEYALHKYKYDLMEEIQENKKKGQLSLFDDLE